MDVQKAPLHTPSLEEVAKGTVLFSLSSVCSETIGVLYYRPQKCKLVRPGTQAVILVRSNFQYVSANIQPIEKEICRIKLIAQSAYPVNKFFVILWFF